MCMPHGEVIPAILNDILVHMPENPAQYQSTKRNKWWNFNFDTNCLETAHPLSSQERKILCCLAKGKSSNEIAKALFTSPHTVDTHRRHLLEKTNCVDATGMITYARLVGLLLTCSCTVKLSFCAFFFISLSSHYG